MTTKRSTLASALAKARTSTVGLVIGFLALHAVLALLFSAAPILGTLHALGCVAVGAVYAATTKRMRHVIVIVAYIIGCEVLWRMTKCAPLWEFGKYASLSILLVGLARIRWRRNRTLALAYFALLLPSAVVTLMALPLDMFKEGLSFNLSGPLLLMTAVLFCSNVQVAVEDLRATFLALLGPSVGVAALCYLSTTRQTIEFVTASNDTAAAGFGANQVSAALGLATMFALFLTFERRLSWRLRLPLLGLAILFAAQAALTFSRGGLVLALAGTCAAVFFMLKGNARARMSIALISLTLALLGKFVIEPRLDDFTGGKLSVRYTDTRSSGRTVIIDSELSMFRENPVFGVGPGMGVFYRAEHDLRLGVSHTEYTRMLGEHGMFGILSITTLLALAYRAARAARENTARGLACALLVWALLFLAVNATRLAAPSFVFGLAFALRTPPASKLRA